MISIRFIPIDKWPHDEPIVRTSPFSATYGDTLKLLGRELRMLGARNVVMQAFFRPNQLRHTDSWPLSDARPSKPGVILSLETRKKGSLSFPCYTYNRYDDNVRAIALSLEALRAVDRYGVTQRAEQYQGWARIEAPLPGGFRDKEAAAAFLATQCGDEDPESWIGIMSDPLPAKRITGKPRRACIPTAVPATTRCLCGSSRP